MKPQQVALWRALVMLVLLTGGLALPPTEANAATPCTGHTGIRGRMKENAWMYDDYKDPKRHISTING